MKAMEAMEAMKKLITGQKTIFQLPLVISSKKCLHNMSYFTRNINKCSRLHSFPVTRYVFMYSILIFLQNYQRWTPQTIYILKGHGPRMVSVT